MSRAIALCFAACLSGACGPDDADGPGEGEGEGGDGGGVVKATGCPALTGAPGATGTIHESFLETDEVWKAEDSPHIVSHFGGMVQDGLKLTIEPCTLVKMRDGADLSVGENAQLIARGTGDEPIVFDPGDEGEWGSMRAEQDPEGPSPAIDLAYVTLRHGGSQDPIDGAANDHGGVLSVGGHDTQLNGDPLVAGLRVDHVTIEDTPDWGLYMGLGATFTDDSNSLTIQGTTRGIARISVRAVGTLPVGTYVGDSIVVTEGAAILPPGAYAFRDRGVPYILGDGHEVNSGPSLDIGDDTIPGGTLTIEPGVTVKMKGSWTWVILGTGALIAQGTAEKPIVLTSAEETPQAGDWGAVLFFNDGTGSTIDHTTIAYAGDENTSQFLEHCEPGGATSTTEHASVIFTEQPVSRFISDSTISQGAAYGINLAYIGTLVDFTPTNTFTDIALCKQTTPQESAGVCPTTVTCPP